MRRDRRGPPPQPRRNAPRSARARGGVEPALKRHGLARWLSKFGLMSRTEAEKCVRAGRVQLNRKVVTDPERAAHPDRDEIVLDGRPLRAARKVYIALHKPAGHITTASDPHGRPTAYELLPAHLLPPAAGRAQAVGRLDADTSGLLLFTNDTEFAARVTDGAGDVEKVYEAVIRGRLDPGDRLRFERGVEIDGTMTRPARCRLLQATDASTRVEITLTEGRNRQIRRMWSALGYDTLELKRLRIGPISLGDLGIGRARAISEFERSTLLVPRDWR